MQHPVGMTHEDSCHEEVLYGSNFTCTQSGVWDVTGAEQLPVCAHHESSQSPNNSLGYNDIMLSWPAYNQDLPLMTAPSLELYKSTSPCVRRCQLYTYTMLEDSVSPYDLDMVESDVYVYFASPVVETWTEFCLMSWLDLVSVVGGNVGLLLRMSLLSIVLLVRDLWKKGIKLVTVCQSKCLFYTCNFF